MNYQHLYDELISFRKVNIPSGYVERHHIVMRSLGGSDEASNVVALTAREHYIAHLLLHKIHRWSETAYALWMMQCKSSAHEDRPFIKSSRMYEWARKEFSKYISRNNKITSKGERNSQHGTRWICNLDLKENLKIPKTSEVPQGWILGRNTWNIVDKKIHIRLCKKCNCEFSTSHSQVLYCSTECKIPNKKDPVFTAKLRRENNFARRNPDKQRAHAKRAGSLGGLKRSLNTVT